MKWMMTVLGALTISSAMMANSAEANGADLFTAGELAMLRSGKFDQLRTKLYTDRAALVSVYKKNGCK